MTRNGVVTLEKLIFVLGLGRVQIYSLSVHRYLGARVVLISRTYLNVERSPVLKSDHGSRSSTSPTMLHFQAQSMGSRLHLFNNRRLTSTGLDGGRPASNVEGITRNQRLSRGPISSLLLTVLFQSALELHLDRSGRVHAARMIQTGDRVPGDSTYGYSPNNYD